MSLVCIYDGKYDPDREDRMDYRISQVPIQGADARLQGHTIQERRQRGMGSPKIDYAKKDVLGDNTLGYISFKTDINI